MFSLSSVAGDSRSSSWIQETKVTFLINGSNICVLHTAGVTQQLHDTLRCFAFLSSLLINGCLRVSLLVKSDVHFVG